MDVCSHCEEPAVPHVQKLLTIPLVELGCPSCGGGLQCSAHGWLAWAGFVVPALLGGPAGWLGGMALYLALQTWWVGLRPAEGFKLP